MDRVDKALLILPFLPLFDLISTLFALNLGGVEIGFLARPVLEHYGRMGLVFLSASASMIFLVFMAIVIYIKHLYAEKWRFKWIRLATAVPVYWLFLLQAFYVSTVISNFLVPLAPLLTETLLFRALPAVIYFVGIAAFTKQEIA